MFPNAAAGALDEEDFAAGGAIRGGAEDDQRRAADDGRGFFGGFDGEFILAARGEGLAVGAQGAEEAGGILRRAEGAAEFHEGLIEVAVARSGAGLGGDLVQFGGALPQEGVVFGVGEVLVVAGEAGEETGDVAVDDGRGEVEGDGGDGAGGVAADPGKVLQEGGVGGELAGVIGDELLGGGMKVAGAAVIAEARPKGQDVLQGSGGEVSDRGIFLQEAVVIGFDGFDLGLLKHRFGEPDGVRVAAEAPGHGAVGVDGVVPGEHGGDEVTGGEWQHGGNIIARMQGRECHARASGWRSGFSGQKWGWVDGREK